MKTKFGFTKFIVLEFENWLRTLKVGRTILRIQQHHTYIPAYIHFDANNQNNSDKHFDMQKGMRYHHVNRNGWRDIGQHFTIFPDGYILTGRSLEYSPAGIDYNNNDAICIENIGFFDTGKDIMRPEQKEAIVAVTALLCEKFNLPIDTDSIVYHHWFRMSDGLRNNGAGGNKTCPGTNFFGGNKVSDCEHVFLPLVYKKLNGYAPTSDDSGILKYAIVTAWSLNVRIDSDARSHIATDRTSIKMGAIIRVYEENKGWFKISKSANHWVSGRYTKEVNRKKVNTSTLNVRSGPGVKFPKVGRLTKNEQVFIVESHNNWSKIALDSRYVSTSYLSNI